MAIRLNAAHKLRLRGGRKIALARPQGTPATPLAGTAIALTDVMADRIYQRSGTSKAVTVTGTYGGNPSGIQARAVPEGTSLASTAYPWTTIATSPTGGAFSGSLTVAQGGWYNLQVRDSVNTALSAAGSNKFGVGILISVLGQSNAANFLGKRGTYPLTDRLTRKWESSAWQRVGNYNDSLASGLTYPDGYGINDFTSVVGGDGAVLLANHLLNYFNVPIGILQFAVNGAPVESWQPGGTGEYYNTFLSGLDSIGGDCEVAIWVQGEVNNGMASATYQAYLQNTFNGVKAHIGRGTGFIFGAVTIGNIAAGAASNPFDSVRKGILDFTKSNIGQGAYYFGPASDYSLDDAVHWNAEGQRRASYRYYKGILAAKGLLPYGSEGPHITSVTRSGAVITVTVAHNGGTALLDGAGGTGTTALGFRVYDGGTLATISATAITGANTISITLSAVPSGTVTFDYGNADRPFEATAGATDVVLSHVIYDNDTIPFDTRGVPLQLLPLVTLPYAG